MSEFVSCSKRCGPSHEVQLEVYPFRKKPTSK